MRRSCGNNFKPASFDGIFILGRVHQYLYFLRRRVAQAKTVFFFDTCYSHGLLRQSVLLSNGQSRRIYLAFVAAFVLRNQGVVVPFPWTHFNHIVTTCSAPPRHARDVY